jgi:hypothetical protein
MFLTFTFHLSLLADDLLLASALIFKKVRQIAQARQLSVLVRKHDGLRSVTPILLPLDFKLIRSKIFVPMEPQGRTISNLRSDLSFLESSP